MLPIALIGYGKMGKMIEQMAQHLPVSIVAIIDPNLEQYNVPLNDATLKDARVCLDFTTPRAVLDNVKAVCACKRNLVIGTTGWQQQLPEVEQLVSRSGIGLLYGSNMSIGMNLFYEVVERAAEVLSAYEEYDAYGLELHHRQKADSPSGTAKELTDILLKYMPNKQMPLYDKIDRKIREDELHFASVRSGWITGTHTIGFDSEADTIELTHRLRNRTGLALGALKAALWLADKQGVHTFREFIRSN